MEREESREHIPAGIIASFKVHERLSRRLLANLETRDPGHPFNCLQEDPNLGFRCALGPAIVQILPESSSNCITQVKRQKLGLLFHVKCHRLLSSEEGQ